MRMGTLHRPARTGNDNDFEAHPFFIVLTDDEKKGIRLNLSETDSSDT